MLETLADVQIATNLIKQSHKDGQDEHPIDAHYNALKCHIEPLDKNSEDYDMILNYVKNTHEKTTPKIKNIYRVLREAEQDRFKKKIRFRKYKITMAWYKINKFCWDFISRIKNCTSRSTRIWLSIRKRSLFW